MSPSANHLGKAKIAQLLAAVGSACVQDQAAGDLTPFDWRDPHSFDARQLGRLAQTCDQVAARLGTVFTRSFSRQFIVAPAAITQHFAGDLRRCIDPDSGYCVTFGPDKGPSCGFFAISSRTMMAWVTRLLGDTETEGNADRPLSSLEESLLSDLVSAVIEVFLASLRPHETLKSSGRLTKGQPDIQLEPTEEICRIVFQVRETDQGDPAEIVFLLSCNRLAALAGKAPAAMPRTTPQELSQTLMEHLQQMPVTVTARLASTTIGFQEILDLGPGDVLLLDKSIDDLVDLVIEGRTVFRGRPARSEGQYAVLVREGVPQREEPRPGASPQAGRVQETPNPKTPGEPRKG